MLCTAFVAGCAFPFIMPARMAITMKVVGPQRLQSAMGFQSGAMNLNRILGPAVMGLIVAQFLMKRPIICLSRSTVWR